jgi:arylsulfatase A-like enzyme
MKRKALISYLAVACLASFVARAAEKPNLIVILADDQGYADVGCYGAKGFKTPEVDRMAEQGVRFTSFYAAPWCSPARASLMTGTHHHRIGINRPLNGPAVGLHPDEITVAEHLKEEGYATALIGKWHLGLHESMSPVAQGFDLFSGIPLSHIRHGQTEHTDGPKAYCGRQWRRMAPGKDDEVEFDPDDTLFTQRITRESLEFISAHKDKPFFLFMSHAQVHREVLASKKFEGKSDYGVWGDAVQELDWSVGEVLKTLRELGIDEKTLVIYVSDNGPSPHEVGSAGPLKGKKGSTWEGGLRVPCIMRWPGKIPAGLECDEVASIMDIFPTFAKRIGTAMPAGRVIDGRDIWPMITGREGAKSPHEEYFYCSNKGLQGVRSGPWKLHLVGGKAELFNLEDDIGEATDVSAKHPGQVKRLQELMEEARADMGAKPGGGANSRPLGTVSDEEGKRISKKFLGP